MNFDLLIEELVALTKIKTAHVSVQAKSVLSVMRAELDRIKAGNDPDKNKKLAIVLVGGIIYSMKQDDFKYYRDSRVYPKDLSNELFKHLTGRDATTEECIYGIGEQALLDLPKYFNSQLLGNEYVCLSSFGGMKTHFFPDLDGHEDKVDAFTRECITSGIASTTLQTHMKITQTILDELLADTHKAGEREILNRAKTAIGLMESAGKKGQINRAHEAKTLKNVARKLESASQRFIIIASLLLGLAALLAVGCVAASALGAATPVTIALGVGAGGALIGSGVCFFKGIADANTSMKTKYRSTLNDLGQENDIFAQKASPVSAQ